MTIALVTGASSGIGREFVRYIDTRCGHMKEIWVIARRTDRLEALRGQIRLPLRILTMDLADADSIQKLSDLLEKNHVRIGAAALCAGFGLYGRYDAIPVEEQLEMIDVNVRAVAGMAMAILPYMAKGGRIFMMSSAAAFIPQPGFGTYAATKAFVLSLSRSLAAEMRSKKVQVTAICPGPVDTDFFLRSGSGGKLGLAKTLFMVKPEQVVAAAWRDAKAGKDISVCGIPMKLFAAAVGKVPQGPLIGLMGRLISP